MAVSEFKGLNSIFFIFNIDKMSFLDYFTRFKMFSCCSADEKAAATEEVFASKKQSIKSERSNLSHKYNNGFSARSQQKQKDVLR